ncbi:MAG: formylglycine-generating enzyme family protein [Sodaliphilus sp.]|nr:formylglycine-generating enzyme family protein [Bacteroidales bacterium]MDY5280701.1 formylglycine-generating enzyme family protein [Sodaliphilus sp.]MDY5314855.1 formylglycine-generating enzyme family protein [Sodaliphilus sp.]
MSGANICFKVVANSGRFTVRGVSFEMVRVEGGTFRMGATSEQGSDVWDNEKPVHSVTLSGYYIGKTEVTQALWKAVMGINPSRFKGDYLPVENVSWDDCQEFIRKLNSMTGQNFRLPTEAEWEFACRGGNNSRGYKYSGSNNLGSVAWYDGNSGNKTHPVGTKAPNELGIYDMSGNVWEWCADWYGDYSSGAQTNPTGPYGGSNRVYRGGSWNYDVGRCRSSNRDFYYPWIRDIILGLRLALSL